MKNSLLVFDLDGTLIPTMQGFADIAAGLIRVNYGWDFGKARRAYLDTSGIAFFRQLELLFPKDARNAETEMEFERLKKKHFFSQSFERNLKEMLWKLKGEGLTLTVSSNNFDFLVQRFIHTEAPDLFHRVCGYRDGFEKGNDHFNWLEKELKFPRSEMLFVGDSLSDLKMARENGVSFVGVEGTFTAGAFLKTDPNAIILQSLIALPEVLTNGRHRLSGWLRNPS